MTTETPNWVESFLKNGCILSMDQRDSSGEKYCLIGWNLKKNQTSGMFFKSDFYLDEGAWYQPEGFKKLSISSLYQILSNSKELHFTPNWRLYPKSKFESAFKKLQASFDTSNLVKAVPFIYDYSDVTVDSDLVRQFICRGLTEVADQKKYLYGFWDEEEGFVGATPEKLFFINYTQKELSTMALAGTKKKHLTSDVSLINSKKDKLEHQYVIDEIKHKLSKIGEVNVGQTQELQLSHLVHLYTPISCSLFDVDYDLDELIASLHPTPALGGYPRNNALDWLRENDPDIDRSNFGAPFGFRNDQEALMVVCIRGLQWTPKKLSIQAGCGIIKESQFEHEWQELQSKLQSTKNIFITS